MRLVGLSLLILLFASCSSCPDTDRDKTEGVLKVNTYLERVYDSTFSSHNNRNYTVYETKTSILNQTDTLQAFWIMKCSWEDNFILSSKYYDFVSRECNGNFPTVRYTQPHDSIVFITNIHSWNIDNLDHQDSIRIGFVFVDGRKFASPDDYLKIMDDKSLQTSILWSDKLNLKRK